jgi:CHAD domain-containing protein
MARRNPRDLHRVRMAIKRLRYAVEVLRPVLPHADDQYMKQLQAAQLALGQIQDLVVLRRWLSKQAGSPATGGWQSRGQSAPLRQAARQVSKELRERLDALSKTPELIRSLAVMRTGRSSVADEAAPPPEPDLPATPTPDGEPQVTEAEHQQ